MRLSSKKWCRYDQHMTRGSGVSFRHILWHVNANLWLKISGRQEDRSPSMRVGCVSIVLPFRLGPALPGGAIFRYSADHISWRVNASLWLKIIGRQEDRC